MSKHGWGKPASAEKQVRLRFGADKPRKSLENLSAGARLGSSLFLSADEFAGIDRLRRGERHTWADHASFELAEFLPLRDIEGEADLEGLAADDGWLWVIGSHARTRPKPEKMPGECIDLDVLATLKDTRSRCLLARLPLVPEGEGWLPVRRDGARHAGMLAQTDHGNALAQALKKDPLIAPFTGIPAKEGGVDIEGIAVCGSRVALGMRGPVIATHALLLEIEVAAEGSGELFLAGGPVRRLLAMEGLGIRDLKRLGEDLLILAGPSGGLSGPCAIYRWRGWANDPAHDPTKVHLHRPERIVELPFGRGRDHPEGLAAWPRSKNGSDRVLVICDSPADERMDYDARTIVADIFTLPA
jgi:hypothetical protein